jgi:hypothetical protein
MRASGSITRAKAKGCPGCMPASSAIRQRRATSMGLAEEAQEELAELAETGGGSLALQTKIKPLLGVHPLLSPALGSPLLALFGGSVFEDAAQICSRFSDQRGK